VAVKAGPSELPAEADGVADPDAGLPVGAGELQEFAASAPIAMRAAIRIELTARALRCIW
jgi:hypothetical protein